MSEARPSVPTGQRPGLEITLSIRLAPTTVRTVLRSVITLATCGAATTALQIAQQHLTV